jgi:hypothetical protein
MARAGKLLRRPDSSVDRNAPYLAIVVEKRRGGGQQVHAALCRHGYGTTMCDDRVLFEFFLTARADGFELWRPNAWRHRWAEAFLRENRGCASCLDILRLAGDEAGYRTPSSLAA